MIVSAIALLAVPRASAADDPEGDKRAGIEKAKNAGVMIDPNAEAAMAFAPIGTCANDPAQEKCPPAKAVVHVESDALGYYTLTSPGATARTASMRAPSCRFVHSAIYLTAGYLQGDATNECYHAIRRQELYGTLYKYYDGRWVPMVTRQQIRDNGRNSLDNARKTAVHPRHQCLQVPYRSWNFTASAWVLYQDVWYGDGGQSNQAFHLRQEVTTLLVIQAPESNRRFAVVEIDKGATAVDDLDEHRRLGELRGDITSLPVEIGGVMHVIFAGERFDALRTEQVVIEQQPLVPEVCRVRNRFWMSNPRPLVAGMRISASFRDAAGDEWWRYDSPPLPPDGALPPVHGPGWTHWGPAG